MIKTGKELSNTPIVTDEEPDMKTKKLKVFIYIYFFLFKIIFFLYACMYSEVEN
jgi:hypothetical protein